MPKYQSKPSTLIIILKSYPIPSPGPKPQNPDPYIPNPTAPQDNMNAMLEGVTVTGRDGKVTNLEQADGRGRGGLCQVNPCRYIIINTGLEPVQV